MKNKINWKFWTWPAQIRELRELNANWKQQHREAVEEQFNLVRRMNQKLAAAQLETEELRKQLALAAETRLILQRENEYQSGRADAVYRRKPAILTEEGKKHDDLERLLVLAGFEEEHPLWQVVLSYLDEHERNELQIALQHNLTDGQRQFEAGRAASASDLAATIRDVREKAKHEARRMKGK